VSAPTTAADLGVYVHVPFCERVCPYCDFAVEASGALDPTVEDEFVDGLLAELDQARRALEAELADRRLATVYLGGGTPSLLRPESVERVLVALGAAFPGPAGEVTLELNPGRLETARVPGFRAAGVTRVSVGVQSLHDDTLRRLGRAHGGDDARRGLEACLGAGFDSVSADLIYAAPGQGEDELLEDLAWLVDAGVPHVSAYALTVEPDTPFALAERRGQLRLPDEDTALRMSRRLRGLLCAAGLEQYELSNYARRGHRSRHNQRYWLRQSVLGLGPSAASLVGERRFQNPRSRPEWEAGVRASTPAAGPPSGGRGSRPAQEQLSAYETRREALWLGLRRLDGVSRAAWIRRFGEPPEARFGPELGDLRGLGLIEDRAGCIRLTERGILFADDVLLRFVGR